MQLTPHNMLQYVYRIWILTSLFLEFTDSRHYISEQWASYFIKLAICMDDHNIRTSIDNLYVIKYYLTRQHHNISHALHLQNNAFIFFFTILAYLICEKLKNCSSSLLDTFDNRIAFLCLININLNRLLK